MDDAETTAASRPPSVSTGPWQHALAEEACLARLRREHQRTERWSERERNRMQGLFEIDRMAGALGLPESL